MENMIGFDGIGIDPFLVDRIAFSVGKFNVYWYAVLITTGLILAVAFCMWQAKKFDLTVDHILDALLVGLPSGIVGARAYYVLFKLDQYDSFAEMVNIRDGGLAIYGGVICAFLAGLIYCRVKKVNMLALFDIASLGFLIGQSIGRWGNFVNAEAHGSVTDLPWGMTINGYGPYHPTFFYESLWNLIGFALIFLFAKKWKRHHGEVFYLYLAWYGLGRSWIEGLRTDSLYLGPIRVSQALAILLLVAGVVLMILSRKGIIKKLQEATVARAVKKSEAYKPIYMPLLNNDTMALGGESAKSLAEGEASNDEPVAEEEQTEAPADGEDIPRESEQENG